MPKRGPASISMIYAINRASVAALPFTISGSAYLLIKPAIPRIPYGITWPAATGSRAIFLALLIASVISR